MFYGRIFFSVLGDEGLRREMARDDKEEKEGIPLPPSKPKIWSMAELAVCKTPPPGSAQNWQALQNGFSLDPSLRQNPAMSVPALRPNLFMGQGREYAGMETKLNSGLGAEDTPPQTPPNNMKLGLAQHNVIALNPQQAYQAYQGHYTGSSMHYTDNTKLEHHQQYDGMSMAEDCFNSWIQSNELKSTWNRQLIFLCVLHRRFCKKLANARLG